jgi:Family of unknown function (DUF5681)
MLDDDDHGADLPKVGYRNPPRQSRFKPGQSGNPRGRPKGRRNAARELELVMAMPVPVTANGRRRKVSTMSALFLRLREKALGGDFRSMQLLIALCQAHLGDDKGSANLNALLAEDAAILREAGLGPNRESSDGGE